MLFLEWRKAGKHYSFRWWAKSERTCERVLDVWGKTICLTNHLFFCFTWNRRMADEYYPFNQWVKWERTCQRAPDMRESTSCLANHLFFNSLTETEEWQTNIIPWTSEPNERGLVRGSQTGEKTQTAVARRRLFSLRPSARMQTIAMTITHHFLHFLHCLSWPMNRGRKIECKKTAKSTSDSVKIRGNQSFLIISLTPVPKQTRLVAAEKLTWQRGIHKTCLHTSLPPALPAYLSQRFKFMLPTYLNSKHRFD